MLFAYNQLQPPLVSTACRDPVAIATLTAGVMDSVPLDLFFSEYVELTLQVRELSFLFN